MYVLYVLGYVFWGKHLIALLVHKLFVDFLVAFNVKPKGNLGTVKITILSCFLVLSPLTRIEAHGS